MVVWEHSSQRDTCPPSAAVRQARIADDTRAAPYGGGGGASSASGLVTSRIALRATRV
jgi:hypothetical protein